MLTKYYLEIDGIRHEIPQCCIKNWDEVRCAYKRADYSGITRSFTSQFEFVNEAYDMIMGLYLRDGFNSVAILSLYTITDRWEWEERFYAPLDFSSLIWDNYILKINCIDNSLAALIKANKGTKYEFTIGEDIPVEESMEYERIPMVDVLGYEVIGESIEDSSAMKITIKGGVPAYEGDISYISRIPTYMEPDDNITVNGRISYGDQTDDKDSYCLKAEKDVTVNIRGGIALDRVNTMHGANFAIDIYRTGSDGTTSVLNLCSQSLMIAYQGEFNTPSDLPSLENVWVPNHTALVKSTNTIWEVHINENQTSNELYIWEDTGRSFDDFMYDCNEQETKVNLKAGDILWVGATASCLGWDWPPSFWANIIKQKIEFSWAGMGETESIDVISPKVLCEKILDRICFGKLYVNAEFSAHDTRFANTHIIAAESARAISGAKIYSSFTEFVDWMQTVFGYTYYLGPRTKSQFKRAQEYSLEWPLSAKDHLLHTLCPGGHSKQVVLIKGTPYFAVLGDDYNSDQSANFYTKWEGSELYNDPITGKARLDTIFYDEDRHGCFFDTEYGLNQFDGDISGGLCDVQTIYFVHRSELFKEDAEVRRIKNCREVSYNVDSGSIYSTVNIGYDKHDYDGFNGRDEFNFNNTYSTGHTVNDKKLSLISKYRADCYGIEFAVQKRGQDTTDNESDNDVFFVLTQRENGVLVPDRSIVIQNAISDLVFNGAFSPMACIFANAGFIGMQAKNLHLEFASSFGNSNIIIGGRPMSADIDLNDPLMTCGRLTFTTDEVDEPPRENDIVEVESGGILYRGFIDEAVFRYANNEAVKYKLIVKDIEL